MDNLIELFKEELKQIKDEDYKFIVTQIFKNYDLKAFELGSSSSKKYHPLDKDGNLETCLQHTKRVFRVAHLLASHPDIEYIIDKDLLLAGALLHDCVKYGYPELEDHTVFQHPILIKALSPGEGANLEKFKKLCDIISKHHGPWRTSAYSQIILPKIDDLNSWYLHLSDYIASRTYVNIDYDWSDFN